MCWHAYEKKVDYKVSALEDEIMALTKFAVKRYSDTKNDILIFCKPMRVQTTKHLLLLIFFFLLEYLLYSTE